MSGASSLSLSAAHPESNGTTTLTAPVAGTDMCRTSRNGRWRQQQQQQHQTQRHDSQQAAAANWSTATGMATHRANTRLGDAATSIAPFLTRRSLPFLLFADSCRAHCCVCCVVRVWSYLNDDRSVTSASRTGGRSAPWLRYSASIKIFVVDIGAARRGVESRESERTAEEIEPNECRVDQGAASCGQRAKRSERPVRKSARTRS